MKKQLITLIIDPLTVKHSFWSELYLDITTKYILLDKSLTIVFIFIVSANNDCSKTECHSNIQNQNQNSNSGTSIEKKS